MAHNPIQKLRRERNSNIRVSSIPEKNKKYNKNQTETKKVKRKKNNPERFLYFLNKSHHDTNERIMEMTYAKT